MSFVVHALPAQPFAPFFTRPEQELRERRARLQVADSKPGFPCRVSLADAEIGERVLLIHHRHHPCDSPFRASHAIYVREGVEQSHPLPDELPEMLESRLISLRAFDQEAMMVAADIVDGSQLARAIPAALADSSIAYLHLHNAKLGCYLARVTRD